MRDDEVRRLKKEFHQQLTRLLRENPHLSFREMNQRLNIRMLLSCLGEVPKT
jgi:hypothetical protein